MRLRVSRHVSAYHVQGTARDCVHETDACPVHRWLYMRSKCCLVSGGGELLWGPQE